MRTSYGISYQGSKNKIAEDLIALLPEAENFYDLFAGGCAMTHCALLSGKYKNIYANDINTTPQLFIDAINGKYDNETTWITKTYFNEHKFTNPYIRNLWSFNNNQWKYAMSIANEKFNEALWDVIMLKDLTKMYDVNKDLADKLASCLEYDDLNERKNNAAKTIKLFFEGKEKDPAYNPNVLVVINHLIRLRRLSGLNADNVHISNMSYDEIEIKPNSVIYCDIPYKNVLAYSNKETYTAGIYFDYYKFYDWCLQQNNPVFISEYNMPEDKFKCIYSKQYNKHISGPHKQYSPLTTEKLFVPNI